MFIILDVRQLEEIHESTKRDFPNNISLIENQLKVINDCREGIRKNYESGIFNKDEERHDYMIHRDEAYYFSENVLH